jgi:hypothetical protein
MKTPAPAFALVLVLATGLLSPPEAFAVTFTVTPSAVSNTYAGPITLQIGGLTNGEQAAVKIYMDVNSNGVVDAAEPLYDAFKISDGQVNTIGGITNLSMANDSNPAGGSITATLSFALPLQRIVGQKIFRVTSPTGNFPATNVLFNVTNAALGQAVAGRVFVNGAPRPNAVVIALQPPNNAFGGGAVADGSGRYSLALSPGPYAVFPTFPNYFTDQSIAASVVLTNGMTATNNLYLTNGTATAISGNIYNMANSNTLGGVFVQLSSDNLFEIAFTDTNGNYSAAVTPGNWKVKIDASRLAQSGLVAPQGSLKINTAAGSQSNVDFALPAATAMFYGRVVDGTGNPFANLDVFAADSLSQFEARGFTDANGRYCVAVITNNNPWSCQPNSDNPILANYVVSGATQTNLTHNQAVLQNFTALPVTAQISGRLQDNLGNPVAGIQINAFASINGTNFNAAQATTDAGGSYSFGVVNGSWNVFANCCGKDGLDSLGFFDPNLHTVNIPPTNAVLNLTVYPIGPPVLSQPIHAGSSSLSFLLAGAMGTTYTIQVSTNVAATNWSTLLVTNLSSSFAVVHDTQATTKQRFYRAKRGP